MDKHFFCGMILKQYSIHAAVLDQNGKALLCCQFLFDLLDQILPDIFAHLGEFAHLHDAGLHLGLCDQSHPRPRFDPYHPNNKDYKEVVTIPAKSLLSTDLPKARLSASDVYADSKLVAALCALKHAQSYSGKKTSRTIDDPCPF